MGIEIGTNFKEISRLVRGRIVSFGVLNFLSLIFVSICCVSSVGSGIDPKSDLGPMITSSAKDKAMKLCRDVSHNHQ